LTHPAEVKVAHTPLLTLLAELTEQAAEAGRLRVGPNPRRVAAMIMQTVMFNAQSSPASTDPAVNPLTADEVWDFCAHGFART
jgi:hypothetical protein